jgi:hypothetical protein
LGASFACLLLASAAQAQTPAPAEQGLPAETAEVLPPPADLVLDDVTDPRTAAPVLDVYGFADFTFVKLFLPEDSRWRGQLNPHSSMGIGNLNLYLRGNLAERIRSLIEVRFLYLPNGASSVGPTGVVTQVNTTVGDPVETGRNLRWGGIQIERAHVEYEAHELLVIRAGQFLTPYGIWNVDHGAPAIISARRPFVVTAALFPEQQTGIELLGRLVAPVVTVGYHLTLSNGRGPATEYLDQDANKALGGRLFLTTFRKGELTAGTSLYHGGFSDHERRWTLDAAGVQTQIVTPRENGTDTAVAFDLRWIFRSLHLQAEVITRYRRFDDDARPRAAAAYESYLPDNNRFGGYVLVGYRTPWFGVMPYVLAERMHFSTGNIPNAAAVYAGLNLRPDPALVLKVEYFHAWFPDATRLSFGQDPINGLTLQVAWAF